MTDGEPLPQRPWSEPPVPPLPPPPMARKGPPWEQDGPALNRFLETLKGVLLDPVRLFSGMRREGGLGPPLAFAVIGITVGALVSALYRALLSGVTLGMVDGMGWWGGRYGSVSLLSALIVAPVAAVIVTFVGAGIFHVMLMLLDGARQAFETTFRVYAYVAGSTALLSVIPFCGGFIGFIWAIYSTIVGLAHAHEIPMSKSAVAVIAPVFVCCFVTSALMLLFGLSVLAFFGSR